MIYKIHIGQINLIARGEQRERKHTHTHVQINQIYYIYNMYITIEYKQISYNITIHICLDRNTVMYEILDKTIYIL